MRGRRGHHESRFMGSCAQREKKAHHMIHTTRERKGEVCEGEEFGSHAVVSGFLSHAPAPNKGGDAPLLTVVGNRRAYFRRPLSSPVNSGQNRIQTAPIFF